MDRALSTDAVQRAISPTCVSEPGITTPQYPRSFISLPTDNADGGIVGEAGCERRYSASLSSELSDEPPADEVACEEALRGQPAVSGYTVCSICNTILEEGVSMELHVDEEHQGADCVFSMTVYPGDLGIPTNGTLEQLGIFALKEVLTVDKGPNVFYLLLVFVLFF